MYDPITASLIQAGPALKGLTRHELPLQLTSAYATLVSKRLRTRTSEEALASDDLAQIRRLANAYETFAAALPERGDREAASFVAATAHGLLLLSARIRNAARETDLNSRSITSDVSACLLFLGAGYFADAAEIARRFAVSSDATVTGALLSAIAAFATGRVPSARDLARRGSLAAIQHDDAMVTAHEVLYRDIAFNFAILAQSVLDGTDGGAALRGFQEVQRRAVQVLDSNEGSPTILNSFAGPHHLATLLFQAGRSLLQRRLSTIPPPQGTDEENWAKLLGGVAVGRPFLWKSHEEAVQSGYLQRGVSAVLSFPTGSGKSTMAELKIASTLSAGCSAVYLVPTHALASQVSRDLRGAFPQIEVHDSLISDSAYSEVESVSPRVAVMTPERALTMLSADPSEFASTGLIVMDECHLMHPSRRERDRRSVDAMFCLLGLTALCPTADVLLMSAMMANHIEIADWLAELTGRPALPLSINWKPTRQLRGCLMFDLKRVDELKKLLAADKRKAETKSPGKKMKAELHARPYALFGLRQTWATTEATDYIPLPIKQTDVSLSANSRWQPTANRNDVSGDIAAGFAERGMRVLVFAENPRVAGSLARKVALALPASPVLTAEEERLLQIARAEVGRPEDVLGLTDGGAVVHHGLLLPVERHLVESIFRRESVTPVVLVGTPTLAQGINLPAEVVIVSGDDRFDRSANKPVPLEPQELLNAVARAGRAGHASVGVVLVVPGEIVTFNTKERKLGSRWFQLQRDVFSKMDQCLTIDDPLEVMMDVIQSGKTEGSDVEYFLNRLPVDPVGAGSALQRSLGAFRARMKMNLESFTKKADLAVALRSVSGGDTYAWSARLAESSGLSVSLADTIATEVTQNATHWHGTGIEEVVNRFFEWIAEAADRPTAFLRDYEVTDEDEEVRVTLEAMRSLVLMWVAGKTLREIEVAFGGKPTAGCLRARALVLRRIPDVAYGIGVFAQAFRLSVGENGMVPLTLAVASECVKRGFSSAEMLAVGLLLPGDHSRAEVAAILTELGLPASATFDDFGLIRSAASVALDARDGADPSSKDTV